MVSEPSKYQWGLPDPGVKDALGCGLFALGMLLLALALYWWAR